MRLVYLGRLVKNYSQDEAVNPRLWNLIQPGHPSHGSSLSVEGLREIKVITGGH